MVSLLIMYNLEKQYTMNSYLHYFLNFQNSFCLGLLFCLDFHNISNLPFQDQSLPIALFLVFFLLLHILVCQLLFPLHFHLLLLFFLHFFQYMCVLFHLVLVLLLYLCYYLPMLFLFFSSLFPLFAVVVVLSPQSTSQSSSLLIGSTTCPSSPVFILIFIGTPPSDLMFPS